MEIFKRITEGPQAAFDRVNKELLDASSIALGSGATRKDIDKYNRLRDQRLEHRDGTRGHLHLKQKIVLLDRRVYLPFPSKKIPYKLISGTNIVIFV